MFERSHEGQSLGELIDAPSDIISTLETMRRELIASAADSLRRKRAPGVTKCWPMMVHGLGDRFYSLFAQYNHLCPLPRHGGGLVDGRNLAEWLYHEGQLPPICTPRIHSI